MEKRYTKKEIHELRARWQGQDQRIAAIISDLRSGEDWTKNLLASENSGWAEIPLLNTCPPKFKLPYDSGPRDLRGLELKNIDLTRIEGLADSCMDFCFFEKVILDCVSLKGASFCYSKFSNNCVLSRADLQFADLRYSDFSGVSFEDALFTSTNFRGANFIDAILIGAKFNSIVFKEEPWYGFLIPQKWITWTRFGGEFQSPDHLESEKSMLDIRFMEGENLRWAYSRKHPIFGFLWYTLANYGRSPARPLFWGFVIWFLFGILYSSLPLPTSLENTKLGDALCWVSPQIDWNGKGSPHHLVEPFYFSFVTMTTVGYGDITPIDWKGQIYVCVEVLLGYVILALFVATVIQRLT